MNPDIIEGNWKQLTGKIQERWGRLTGDPLTQVEGDRRKLVGMIQEKYGVAKEEAEKQLREWEDSRAA